ncbi:hypothetical protein [Alcanivorax sp.]|jgi:predicted DNA-binding protein|uniref:hypothetical protein n=1 Tax=Alcanivorax sp. TaxID=1872427 RepID=UPI001ABF3F99|nr:hypothetical protein [Alcanivorax sp.]
MASFRFELTEEENERLANLAKCQGVSKAKVLRWLISKLPGDDENAIVEKEKTKGGEKRRIQIRVSDAAYQAIQERTTLGKYQTPAGWVKSLVFSNLSADPVFTEPELGEMRKARLEVHRIGVALNQIAHALNIDTRNAAQLEGMEWGAVIAVVKEVRTSVDNLRLAAIRRWRV